MAVAPAVELVVVWKIITKGMENSDPNTLSTGPIQKRTATSIARPSEPLSNTEMIIERGMATAAFCISSAIES